MTSVGPPQFDTDVEYGLSVPDGGSGSRRWIIPVVLAAAALLLVARLTGSEPTPELSPDTSSTTTTEPPVTTTIASAYVGMDLVTPVHSMTASGDGYFAFGERGTGELTFLTSATGIEWNVVDSPAISGLYSHDEAAGLWPIPGFGFLGAFDDRVDSTLRFAQSSDGESWLPLASLRYKDAPLRVEFVAMSASRALVSVEPRGAAGVPPGQFVLALGSGTVEPVALEKFAHIRTAAYDIGSGALLAVIGRDTDRDAPGPDDRFRWLIDGEWSDAAFDGLAAGEVVRLGTWSGRIVAITENRAHVFDRDRGSWESSSAFGFEGRVLLDSRIGVGGAAVVTSSGSAADPRIFVHVTADMSEWNEVEIVDELTKLELEAVGPDDAILVAFRVGVGLQRHPPGLLVRLLSVDLGNR